MRILLPIAMAVVVASFSRAAAQDEYCVEIGNIAEMIMNHRQEGLPMAYALKALNDVKSADKNLSATVRSMIVAAYDSPAYNSPTLRREAEREFSNEAIVSCMKN